MRSTSQRSPELGLLALIAALLTLTILSPHEVYAAWSTLPTQNNLLDPRIASAGTVALMGDGAGGVYHLRFRGGSDTLGVLHLGADGQLSSGWENYSVVVTDPAGVSEPVALPGDSVSLQVLFLAEGTALLQQLRLDGSRRWPEPGVALATRRSLETMSGLLAVKDQTGATIAAWMDQRSVADWRIVVSKVTAAGSLVWGSTGQQANNLGNNDILEALTTDSHGGALVFWGGRGVSGNLQLQVQHIDSLGTVTWVAGGVRVYSSERTDQLPSVFSDGQGGAYLVWLRSWLGASSNPVDQVHVGHLTAAGAPDLAWPDSGLTIASPTVSNSNAVILPSTSGDMLVLWTDTRPSTNVARVGAGAQIRWVQNQLSDTRDRDAVLDGRGGAWWAHARGIDTPSLGHRNLDLYATHVTGDGDFASGPGIAVGIAVGGQFSPALAADSADGVVIAFNDTRWQPNQGVGPTSQIYAQNVNADGSLGGTVVATDATLVAADAYEHGVALRWNVPSSQPAYQLERRDASGWWSAVGSVSFANGSDVLFVTDQDVVPGRVYEYRLSWQESGSTRYSSAVSVTVPVTAAFSLSVLDQPGNEPGAGFRYALARSDRVALSIHDVSGRRVRALGGLDGAVGSHVVRWDGRDGSGSPVPAGLYFVRLQAAEGVRVARLTLTW